MANEKHSKETVVFKSRYGFKTITELGKLFLRKNRTSLCIKNTSFTFSHNHLFCFFFKRHVEKTKSLQLSTSLTTRWKHHIGSPLKASTNGRQTRNSMYRLLPEDGQLDQKANNRSSISIVKGNTSFTFFPETPHCSPFRVS